MRGPTLPFAPTKTYGPISVDLRDEKIFFFPFSLSILALPLWSVPFSFPFDFYLLLFFKKIGYMAHIAPCVHLSFGYISALKQFTSFQFNLF